VRADPQRRRERTFDAFAPIDAFATFDAFERIGE
jgi:hypothetical protein